MNAHNAGAKDGAAITVPRGTDPAQLEATDFKTRWETHAAKQRFPTDPLERIVLDVAELRRQAAEFFSWGLVHQTKVRAQLDALLPPDVDRRPRRCQE